MGGREEEFLVICAGNKRMGRKNCRSSGGKKQGGGPTSEKTEKRARKE